MASTYLLHCLHTNGNKVSAVPFMCKELRGKTETHCSYFFLSTKLTRWLYCYYNFGFFYALKVCALLTYFEDFVAFIKRAIWKFGQKESSQVPVGFSDFRIRCIFVGFMVVLHPLRSQKWSTEMQRLWDCTAPESRGFHPTCKADDRRIHKGMCSS